MKWIHKQKILVGFRDFQDTAEAGSCSHPLTLTRPSLRKMMGSDCRELGKRGYGIPDVKIHLS